MEDWGDEQWLSNNQGLAKRIARQHGEICPQLGLGMGHTLGWKPSNTTGKYRDLSFLEPGRF